MDRPGTEDGEHSQAELLFPSEHGSSSGDIEGTSAVSSQVNPTRTPIATQPSLDDNPNGSDETADPGSLDDLASREEDPNTSDTHADTDDFAFGNRTEPDEEPPDGTGADAAAVAAEETLVHLEDLQIAQDFIEGLRGASLDSSPIHPDLLDRLRHPPEEELHIEDRALRFSLEMYLHDTSEESYEQIRGSLQRIYDQPMLTYSQIKSKVQEISGIYPIYNDMCLNSCLAYVGPFAKDMQCRTCGESRYDQHQLAAKGKRVARQQFVTNPIGPQIQAAYRSRESALDMAYRSRCTAQVLHELEATGSINTWADYIHGTEYLEAARAGDIDDNTTVLMISLDGAQLYRMKASDCWVYIWVLLDRAPETRYKKQHVLIGGVIPGPNKPGNIDSFMFPGLHHLSALMNDGLVIWDAARNIVFTSKPFLAFMTADGPGMTELNGLVGHSGGHGCRLYCELKGRRKPDVGHYYPACLRPHNYNVTGCMHDDVDLQAVTSFQSQRTAVNRYERNLKTLISSPNVTAYRSNRLITGIVKPSLVSGLRPECIFSVPGCFPGDLMHLAALNEPDLLLGLWRATISCDTRGGDTKATWDWAVLADAATWNTHGKLVAAATPYLPGSFDRPPRNPAEKLNSGYKAMEYLNYIYGLGPGLFYGLLPSKYWKHFCKLVRGIRIAHQKRINTVELQDTHCLLLEFCREFEELYYQRHLARLHFVRQSIHALSHICPETTRIGPYAGVTQWTMENAIGNLGREIRQPSNPFANLSQRAVRRCRINAIKAMLPELSPIVPLPRNAEDLGNGYILLSKREKIARRVTPAEGGILAAFVQSKGIPVLHEWLQAPSVARWARLRLPTGQVARLLWKEEARAISRIRISHNVKASRTVDNDKIKILTLTFTSAGHE